jgi:hypothetical protein
VLQLLAATTNCHTLVTAGARIDNAGMQSMPQTPAPGDMVTVPEGFKVRYWKVLPAKGVYETPGGLVIGSFGYVGDDFAGTQTVFQLLRERRSQRQTTLIDQEVSLSHSFSSWQTLETRAVEGPIVWTAHADGLSWLLADAHAREQLIAGFQRFRGRPQWLALEALPPAELRSLLVGTGVSLRFSSPQHHFLVEIDGPDGRTLTSVLGGAPSMAQPSDVAALKGRPMLAARSLVSQLDTLGTLAAVVDALLAHPAALVVRSDLEGQVPAVTFPQFSEPLLPVYPDTATWMRADRELRELGPQATTGTMGMAQFEPRELLEWARDLDTGLALGWYASAEAPIKYLGIPRRDLQVLCNGALPRRYSFVDHVRMRFGLKPRSASAR